jgi:hypothetical protein
MAAVNNGGACARNALHIGRPDLTITTMKLLLCLSCADVIKMNAKIRHCQCGQSSGRYLDDGSTVEQSHGSISIALHNHELRDAISAFHSDPRQWHPLMVFRAFLNPLSENDVIYLDPEPAPVPHAETTTVNAAAS